MNHEESTVRAFIQKSRQDRVLFLLAHATRRTDFTRELAHFKWLDDRFATPISTKSDTVEGVVQLLQKKGAGETAWIISEDSKIDGSELPLKEAVAYIWGRGIGTILSCVPGRLGYFEDEERGSGRLLER